MADLTTTYLGLKLRNPLVASASPLSQKIESAQQLEQAGVSAIVMYSLFEEQIMRDSLKLHEDLSRGTDQFAEALSYFPEVGHYTLGTDTYITQLENLKKTLKIPVIGSLNGMTTGGWIDYAKKIADAGADALELNIYFLATDPTQSSSELEKNYLTLVQDIRKAVSIPLAVKLSPFFTALPHFAQSLANEGVDGIVLFNRFYQPDFDLEELEVVPNLVLSNSDELRLPLRWIAILYKKIKVDFALTSGVHAATDIIKAMMAGASVTMVASNLLMHGIHQATTLLKETEQWMQEHEYESIEQMKGSMSQQSVANPASFERANYLKVLSSY